MTAKKLASRRSFRKTVRQAAAFCGLAWTLATVIAPLTIYAQSPADRRTPEIMDVALGPDGTLRGRTLTGPENAVMAAEAVEITYDGRVVAATESDRHGNFEVRGLKSGVHVVATGERRQVCRFWTADAAPPNSVRGIAFVENADTVVRAQGGGGILGYVAQNPGRVAFDGIVLATSATALVIAVDAKDSSD